MFAAGLVDEVRRLLADERGLSRTARQAVGYREVVQHLAGERSLEDTIDLVKTRTRQFAKRQMTWFRSLSECRSVPIAGDDTAYDDTGDGGAARIAERIAAVGGTVPSDNSSPGEN
jgi:tRNA dimethylallyltransferase